MASLKHSSYPPSISITYSYGGYLVKCPYSLVDILNFGLTSGASSSRGAWSTDYARPSLLSSLAPSWSSWTTGGETEVGIIGIFRDDWDSSFFFA